MFEIAKSAAVYASTPTTLVSFNGGDGANPYAGLITDAAGNLFGTTLNGGASEVGTVFEIAKTAAGGYATTPTTLVSFNGGDGANPAAGLIADAGGNLFGTTGSGGASGYGTVFEIAKTAVGGYATTPTTLVSFNGGDGANPQAGLITDAAGDLFGTTGSGGASGNGTVFEIAKSVAGYASTPTTLVSFNGGDGANPFAGLVWVHFGGLAGREIHSEGLGSVDWRAAKPCSRPRVRRRSSSASLDVRPAGSRNPRADPRRGCGSDPRLRPRSPCSGSLLPDDEGDRTLN